MIEERELKLLIRDVDYYSILEKSQDRGSSFKKQINYYFDTNNFELNNLGITLRIRKENNDWLLCLKVKKQDNNFISNSDEYEYRVNNKAFQDCSLQPKKILNYISEEAKQILIRSIDINEIKLLGSINNERHKINILDSYLFELDKSVFPENNLSYELEVEGLNSQEECNHIINFLENIGVELTVNRKSKYKRFVELCKVRDSNFRYHI